MKVSIEISSTKLWVFFIIALFVFITPKFVEWDREYMIDQYDECQEEEDNDTRIYCLGDIQVPFEHVNDRDGFVEYYSDQSLIVVLPSIALFFLIGIIGVAIIDEI